MKPLPRLCRESLTGGRLLLEADFGEAPAEAPAKDLVGKLSQRRRAVLYELSRAIRTAATDRRVVGLIAHVGNGRMPLADAAELRDAVAVFRGSGKPALAWAETFGEGGTATGAYYLASAFGEIWLQPSGEVGFAGLAIEPLFFAGLAERAKVRWQISARHEYKGAAETFTRSSFSEPSREALQQLLDSSFATVVSAVASERGIDAAALREAAAGAPLSAERARETGLIDAIGYRDEAYAALRERLGSTPAARYVARYRPRPPVRSRLPIGDRRKVALVTGHGVIRLSDGPGPGGGGMPANRIGAALRAARNDPRIAAVVFRVNSPGGSYVASDSIAREVALCRQAGKPVVVSMGAVAASGGYFVAAGADAIVAQPTTITGSIGVLSGKPVLGEALARAGVSHDRVETGPATRMMSLLEGFSTDQQAKLDALLDAIYDDFVGKVAAGRGLSREAVHEVARGRIWTGADAAERGLVDTLGGIFVAARLARQQAGLRSDAALVRYPSINLVQRLRPATSSDDLRAAAAFDVTSLAAGLGGDLAARLDGGLTAGLGGALAAGLGGALAARLGGDCSALLAGHDGAMLLLPSVPRF